MFTVTVLDILLLQGRSVLGPAQCIAESERVIFLVKNQKDVRLLLKVLEKRFSYKPRRFGMVFKLCWFCSTVSVPQNWKYSIFEIPVIPQTLNINNKRTTSANFINLHIIRKAMEYSLKEVVFKTMFIVTVLEILLLQSRSVLRSTERVPGSQRIKFSVKNKKKAVLQP